MTSHHNLALKKRRPVTDINFNDSDQCGGLSERLLVQLSVYTWVFEKVYCSIS